MEIIFVAILIGLIPAYIAHTKGRNFFSWWVYGALLFIVAIIHSIVLKDNRPITGDVNIQEPTEADATIQNVQKGHTQKKPMYLKYAIIIGVVLLVTLPFHYAPSHLMIFPKENFTFSNTFIFQSDIDNLISRYNSNNLFERVSITNEPLFKKLKEKGLIQILDETTAPQNTNNQTEYTPNTNTQTTTQENGTENYSEEDKKLIEKIKAKVKRDFPDDHFMQKMMFDQEVEAYFYMKTVTDLKVKRKIQRDFPMDFFMQKMMYNQEIDAKEQMK